MSLHRAPLCCVQEISMNDCRLSVVMTIQPSPTITAALAKHIPPPPGEEEEAARRGGALLLWPRRLSARCSRCGRARATTPGPCQTPRIGARLSEVRPRSR
jgi:hypothetical protein